MPTSPSIEGSVLPPGGNFKRERWAEQSALYQVMEAERERFRSFRQALSKEAQEAFDRLFDRVKMHTSAGVYMSNPWPMETILMPICLEHGKMIEEILGVLKEKEKKE